MARTGNQRERSFPLISLIQLFTFCVALLVCLDGTKINERMKNIPNDWVNYLLAVVLAGMFGLLIGASIGLGQICYWRSMAFCGAIGSVVGVLLLAIYAAPANPAQAISAALLPLLTTLILRARAS